MTGSVFQVRGRGRGGKVRGRLHQLHVGSLVISDSSR